jgi:uncharacterized protein YecE (DUF72 family)
MPLRTGTSGFSFKEWKGAFYPADLPDKKMLGYYSGRLKTVEVNNTFYRMPKRELVEGWGAQVPGDFRFVLKAPQRITHREKLEHSEETVAQFLEAAAVLGEKLGGLLFQLPPFFRKDVPRLRAFLPALPAGVRVAFEFRHPSWFDEETYEALRERNVALVGGDSDAEEKSPPLVVTADFGYLRLRAPEYDDGQLTEWAERIQATRWTDTFAFLKHEIRGPEFAEKLGSLFARRAGT